MNTPEQAGEPVITSVTVIELQDWSNTLKGLDFDGLRKLCDDTASGRVVWSAPADVAYAFPSWIRVGDRIYSHPKAEALK